MVGRSNRLAPTKWDARASSSGGQSNGLLSRGSEVRILSGAPLSPDTKVETMVSVAQLAEHRVVAPGVEGSNPFTHPKFHLIPGGPEHVGARSLGPLAQSVEQLTLNQRVRSSTLRRPT